MGAFFDYLDGIISAQMWRFGVPVLRVGLVVMFIWFGALKLAGTSPALDLITRTVYWFDPKIFVPVLGCWEIAIGVCLAVPALTRAGILLLALQMPGTFLPLILLPQVWRFALPGLGNVWMVMVKATALISVIQLPELMRNADIAARAVRLPFTFFFAASLIYLGITVVSMWGQQRAEAWANRGVRRA